MFHLVVVPGRPAANEVRLNLKALRATRTTDLNHMKVVGSATRTRLRLDAIQELLVYLCGAQLLVGRLELVLASEPGLDGLAAAEILGAVFVEVGIRRSPELV